MLSACMQRVNKFTDNLPKGNGLNPYCIYKFHPEFLKRIERKFKLIYEGNEK